MSDDESTPLPTVPPGTRMAVVGGGLSGLIGALSLIAEAQARKTELHVDVFSASPARPSSLQPPILLTPDCRLRLSRFGCVLDDPRRRRVLPEIQLLERGSRLRVPLHPGSQWLVSGAGEDAFSPEDLRQLLASLARRHGIQFHHRHVTELRRDDAPLSEGGPWQVTAHGRTERYARVLVCTGAPMTEPRLLGDAKQAPSLPAVTAVLKTHASAWAGPARAVMQPCDGVDALLLVPQGNRTVAFGFGPACGEEDFCEALMIAVRDDALEEGFELERLEPTLIASGVGSALHDATVHLLGGVAAGSPLMAGLKHVLVDAAQTASTALSVESDRLDAPWSFDERVHELVHTPMRTVAKTLKRMRSLQGEVLDVWASAMPDHSLRGFSRQGVWGPGTPAVSLLQRAATTRAVGRFLWGPVSGAEATSDDLASAPTPGEPLRIYVVDDDDDIREGITEALESRGATVVPFADELSLLGAIACEPPHVVILDVVLQHVDGLRLCRRVREMLPSGTAKVFVMSGLDLAHLKASAVEAGADAFLAKPFDPKALWEMATEGTQHKSALHAVDGDAAHRSA